MSVALQIAVVVGYLLPLIGIGALLHSPAPALCPVRARHSRTRR